MKRDPKKVFSRTYNTKARRDLIDQDYLDKLSPEDLEWFAKFTEEYYGATFTKNAGFIKKEALLPIIQKEVDSAPTEKHFARWSNHLERVTLSKDKYIQVSENEKKAHNVDLRKCRAVDIYYKNENDNYVKNKKYKYSDENIIDPNDPKALKECNDRANNQRSCILNSYNQVNSEYLDIEVMKEVMGIEDYFILNEELAEYERIEGKEIIPKAKKVN